MCIEFWVPQLLSTIIIFSLSTQSFALAPHIWGHVKRAICQHVALKGQPRPHGPCRLPLQGHYGHVIHWWAAASPLPCYDCHPDSHHHHLQHVIILCRNPEFKHQLPHLLLHWTQLQERVLGAAGTQKKDGKPRPGELKRPFWQWDSHKMTLIVCSVPIIALPVIDGHHLVINQLCIGGACQNHFIWMISTQPPFDKTDWQIFVYYWSTSFHVPKWQKKYQKKQYKRQGMKWCQIIAKVSSPAVLCQFAD